MRLTTFMLTGAILAAGTAVPRLEAAPLAPAAAGISPLLQSSEELAVLRAYRSLLNREPTARELWRYRVLMTDYGWTEQDVRRDIRDRPDYQRYTTRGGVNRPNAVIRRAYQDILGRDPDPEGLQHYRNRMLNEGWTEFQVRESLRESPEYQSVAFRTTSADRIIRRAYQDILRREPDPEGLETYRRFIFERGWDEHDVRQALRRSPENRQQRASNIARRSQAQAQDVVRRAYRSVLNREPDAAGMADYTNRVINDNWSEADVVRALRGSDEFRQLRSGSVVRGMTEAEANAAVRRAYLSTLNREPDATGLRDYTARILRDNWTEADVVRALRESDEYRSKNR